MRYDLSAFKTDRIFVFRLLFLFLLFSPIFSFCFLALVRFALVGWLVCLFVCLLVCLFACLFCVVVC